MKSRQWLITLGLLVLVLAAVIGSVLTSDLGAPAVQNSHTRRPPLVDERPLRTARTVSKLASGWDEKRFADQALRVSDNEVDLAFEDALRDAANHPVPSTPETRELYAHVAQAEADVRADQDQLKQLKKQLATASGAKQDSVQEQVDLAQAQLELDQDELDDAKEDLAQVWRRSSQPDPAPAEKAQGNRTRNGCEAFVRAGCRSGDGSSSHQSVRPIYSMAGSARKRDAIAAGP